MKPSVYIETTIVSYLTAKPSRDLVIAAHQQITNEWWADVRPQVECYVSKIDAFHLAVAAWHKMDYLLSWNCKHIASGRVQKMLQKINAGLDVHTPIFCTPEELMEV